MKSACHTDPSHPSQSLIKAIAYPEAYIFISKATSWGCQHEKHAREFYSEQMMRGHCGFAVHECGLFSILNGHILVHHLMVLCPAAVAARE